MKSRDIKIGLAFVVVGGVLGVGSACMENASEGASEGASAGAASATAGAGQVPLFEVDPLWPRPLPNHWVMGSTIGVDVDSRDHVWIIHRQATLAANETNAAGDPPRGSCCIPAPPVLEFDADGNMVGSWGGPGDGYAWPESNHGITVDHMDNVWIGGNGANDSHILKFTRDGRFLLQIGQPNMRTGSNDTQNFWRVAEIEIDAEANEAYVADGYGNKRVAVLDIQTGAMKRFWGAYGNVPDDSPIPPYNPNDPPAQQFRSPMHCAQPTDDDLVYACDRAGDRLQVFRPDGTFVREAFVAPQTLGSGSVWDIAFSHDQDQSFLYVADGSNELIHVLDRETLEVVTTFGDGGRQPGQFYGIHSIAVDSQGNVYTTETYEGKRLQKFTFVGYGSPPREQGTVWPR
jgi:DNA-binding beta-propeller fold protein YncE